MQSLNKVSIQDMQIAKHEIHLGETLIEAVTKKH